jgi:hypothetical protein
VRSPCDDHCNHVIEGCQLHAPARNSPLGLSVLCGLFRAIESDHRALGGEARGLMQETGSSMTNGSAARADTLLDRAERRARNADFGQ